MVFVRGFHKLHGQSTSEFSQSCHLLLKSSGWENTLSTWEMHRWSLLTPCPIHLSSALAGRGLFQGMFFIDGCGWLEIRLPAPFDAPTHLLTPSPLLTPPWSSAPSFPPLWHFILPRTRLGYGKMIQTLRGVVGCGLFWSPRCTNPTATLQSPSQLLSQALKMCGKSSPWPESASLQGPRVNVTRVRPTRGSSAPSEWNFFRGFALKRQEAHGSKSY